MATITGTNSSETLDGTADDDTLRGLGGDATLEGGAGADTLNGGAGIDTATYASSGQGATVVLTSGQGTEGVARSYSNGEPIAGAEMCIRYEKGSIKKYRWLLTD